MKLSSLTLLATTIASVAPSVKGDSIPCSYKKTVKVGDGLCIAETASVIVFSGSYSTSGDCVQVCFDNGAGPLPLAGFMYKENVCKCHYSYETIEESNSSKKTNFECNKIVYDESKCVVAGTGGDPHITTWTNEHFEYHGQCDLVLAKDENFADGLGLEIHIRTKLVRYWSYIKNVAIKIGNDVLEIEGSPNADDAQAHYWVNFEDQGELNTFAGFPVTQKLPSTYKRRYFIDLSSKYPGKYILVELYKEFVRVRFHGDEQTFGNTVGLMGDFKTGKTLARDGVTVMNDYTEFGDEWQVLPSEPKLFHQGAHPQFPELCIKPEDPRGERKRRLAESNISIEDAEAACAKSLSDELSIKDCVYDIMATQDLDMVGAF